MPKWLKVLFSVLGAGILLIVGAIIYFARYEAPAINDFQESLALEVDTIQKWNAQFRGEKIVETCRAFKNYMACYYSQLNKLQVSTEVTTTGKVLLLVTGVAVATQEQDKLKKRLPAAKHDRVDDLMNFKLLKLVHRVVRIESRPSQSFFEYFMNLQMEAKIAEQVKDVMKARYAKIVDSKHLTPKHKEIAAQYAGEIGLR